MVYSPPIKTLDLYQVAKIFVHFGLPLISYQRLPADDPPPIQYRVSYIGQPAFWQQDL